MSNARLDDGANERAGLPSSTLAKLLSWPSTSAHDGDGLPNYLRNHGVSTAIPYGSGKAALRTVLSGRADCGTKVLLPAYIPDAVPEAVIDAGLAVRYFPIRRDGTPDFDAMDAVMDERVTAVLTVEYFGFPQSSLGRIGRLAAECDALHVDDAAHGAFSRTDDQVLGTRGHVGFTSLSKVLPVPNGALLYVQDSNDVATFHGNPGAGCIQHVEASDLAYSAATGFRRTLDRYPAIGRTVFDGRKRMATVSDKLGLSSPIPKTIRSDGTVTPPLDRYRDALEPMSLLTTEVMVRIDPVTIRTERRRNYRAWESVLRDHSGFNPFFDSLPEGVCPLAYPIVAEDGTRAEDLLGRTKEVGIRGVHRWPRLPSTVRSNEEYVAANDLSSRLLAFPVHQHRDPRTIERLGALL